MADFGYSRQVKRPQDHGVYKHFTETTNFYHPPFSVAPVPYGWITKGSDGSPKNARRYGIDFNPRIQPKPLFDSAFLQAKANQLAMLDSFFGAVKPGESLVFCYAKQTPLSEDPRRVIVGVGRALIVEPAVEYEYDRKSDTPRHHHSVLFWNEIFVTPSVRRLMMASCFPTMMCSPLHGMTLRLTCKILPYMCRMIAPNHFPWVPSTFLMTKLLPFSLRVPH